MSDVSTRPAFQPADRVSATIIAFPLERRLAAIRAEHQARTRHPSAWLPGDRCS